MSSLGLAGVAILLLFLITAVVAFVVARKRGRSSGSASEQLDDRW